MINYGQYRFRLGLSNKRRRCGEHAFDPEAFLRMTAGGSIEGRGIGGYVGASSGPQGWLGKGVLHRCDMRQMEA